MLIKPDPQQSDEYGCSPESSFINANSTVLDSNSRVNVMNSPLKRPSGVIAAKTISSTNLLNSTENVSMTDQEEHSPADEPPSLKDESEKNVTLEEDNDEEDATATEQPLDDSLSNRSLVYQAADYVVAVHRQSQRQDNYFLQYHKTRPNLFGRPLLVPWYEGGTNKDLYCAVWIQVARLLSPLPPTPPDQANHATDW